MIEFNADIEHCLETLKLGGTILYPTDTVWGIGCDATNEKAVEKVIELKGRQKNKAFIILLANENDIEKYTSSTNKNLFTFLKKQIEPTTIIYQNAMNLPLNCCSNEGSIAIRITKEIFSKTLISRFKKPILSTSANFSNQTTPKSFCEIDELIINKVDFVVQFKKNDKIKTQPSKIIMWKNGIVKTIR